MRMQYAFQYVRNNGVRNGYQRDCSKLLSGGIYEQSSCKSRSRKELCRDCKPESDRGGQRNGAEKTSAVLDVIGANAPDEVRQTWTEAEKEIGADGHITKCGLWISNDGKHSHMTAVGVQIALKWAKGELGQTDLLGSSVESAINAVNKWIYDLEHPLARQPAKSIDEQRMIMNERAFYEAFLEKLKHLTGQDQ